MSPDIFISYAPQDSGFVTRLHQDLTGRGFSAWFDSDVESRDFSHRFEVKKIIADSQVLLVVLSPQAVKFGLVSDQLRHAKDQGKHIVSVVWRDTDLPTAFNIQLRDVPSIDFAETASTENFERLANTLQPLISRTITQNLAGPVVVGGSTVQVGRVEGANVQVVQGEQQKPTRTLKGLSKKKRWAEEAINPLAMGALVISNIITPLDLEPEDEDFVVGEIKWLFSAVDHLLKLRSGEIDRHQPIALPAPKNAQIQTQTDNRLLDTWKDNDLEYLASQFEGRVNLLTRLDKNLNRDLKHFLSREIQKGEAGKGDAHLQNQIKDYRIRAVKIVQEIAKAISEAYGILVTGPDQLVEFLEEYVNPIALGSLVISNVITPLDLDPGDEEFINGELRWLFSAANNYQKVYQVVVKRLSEEQKKLWANGVRGNQLFEKMSRLLPEIRQEEIARSETLGVPIPPDAQRLAEATNRLLTIPDENELSFYFDIRRADENSPRIIYGPNKSNKVKSIFSQLNSKLQSLEPLRQREIRMGEEGKRNVDLHNSIKAVRIDIVEISQEMADLMNWAYGILVTTPQQLVELLRE